MNYVSFSLWGDNPKYTFGAVRNAQLCGQIYPNWKMIVFVHVGVPRTVVKQLRDFDACTILVDEAPNWQGMFWRFRAVNLVNCNRVIFRDTDSRVTLREAKAVDVWLSSGKSFHIMRDHPAHNAPIQGGMWGVQGLNGLKLVSSKLALANENRDEWGIDQQFLAKEVYPFAKSDACVHDEFFENKAFPDLRRGQEFIGEVFDEQDKPRLSDRNAIAAWQIINKFPSVKARLSVPQYF